MRPGSRREHAAAEKIIEENNRIREDQPAIIVEVSSVGALQWRSTLKQSFHDDDSIIDAHLPVLVHIPAPKPLGCRRTGTMEDGQTSGPQVRRTAIQVRVPVEVCKNEGAG